MRQSSLVTHPPCKPLLQVIAVAPCGPQGAAARCRQKPSPGAHRHAHPQPGRQRSQFHQQDHAITPNFEHIPSPPATTPVPPTILVNMQATS
uniref:Uncharacterized protein n=1 Tax=Arundo donax TaxID=35708 RepID=A0A0A9D972_ARUDO